MLKVQSLQGAARDIEHADFLPLTYCSLFSLSFSLFLSHSIYMETTIPRFLPWGAYKLHNYLAEPKGSLLVSRINGGKMKMKANSLDAILADDRNIFLFPHIKYNLDLFSAIIH